MTNHATGISDMMPISLICLTIVIVNHAYDADSAYTSVV